MKKIILCSVMTILMCCNHACSKDEVSEEIPQDVNYPTTIYRLPEITLSQMRNDFAQRNPNVQTTLNQFGFCDVKEPSGVNGYPGGFTKEEAIAAVKEFVARNPEYTGIGNPDDLQFRSISSSTGYNDAVFWHFRTENQIIFEGIEVVYTDVIFRTQNNTLIHCYGNYFPNVYIPEKLYFDTERAKSQLLGKEAIHLGWAGEYSLGFVKAEHLQDCPTNLIIIPVTTDEKIELRVAWQIRVDAVAYIYTVDVMTGEIIQEIPTIIS